MRKLLALGLIVFALSLVTASPSAPSGMIHNIVNVVATSGLTPYDSFTITNEPSGSVFRVTGSGDMTIHLPPPSLGAEYFVLNRKGTDLTNVDAGSGNFIEGFIETGAGSEQMIQRNENYGALHLICTDTTEWTVFSVRGEWFVP